MLGLLLLYFIGKAFYTLAEEHGKSKWPFAILGVATYYAGAFIGGFVIAILYELYSTTSIDDLNDILLGLMVLPFGLLSCWGLYKLLENSWKKKLRTDTDDLIDAIGNDDASV